MTPEDEFEAAIWQAMSRFKATCPHAGLFVDAIVVAARKYASGDSDSLTALRREVLDLAAAGDTSAEDQPTISTGRSIPRSSERVNGK